MLDEPRFATDNTVYTGRLTLYDVQWINNRDEHLARCTLTIEQLLDITENQMIWTDQRVQRGIKPEAPSDTPIELPLAAGYPDDRYVFKTANADDMVDKLLHGRRLHLHPLTWNLRPGSFHAYWDNEKRRLYIYDGKIYLPDSHHRHQALVKAARIFRESPNDYPDFHPDRQLPVDIYFMTRPEEMEFFFEKNQLTQPTAKSKAYDLTSQDPYALLAKEVIERSPSLRGNVNRVTDTLSARNPQVITLSTLRVVMETVVPELPPSAEDIEHYAAQIAAFYELLTEVRPELGHLDVGARQRIRSASLVDAAVMMHAYGALARMFIVDVAKGSLVDATAMWRTRLQQLAPALHYKSGAWQGDFFARDNPLWKERGVVQETESGRITASNTRQTRAVAAKVLLDRLAVAA